MTVRDDVLRCTDVARYVELATRLRMFEAGAVPTAQEAARDLGALEALLDTVGAEFQDPYLNVVRLKAQIAGMLKAAPPIVH